MQMTNQICSLEISKKLKELGLKQESYFYWVKQFPEDDYIIHYIDHYHHETDLKIFIRDFPDNVSSFTVSELLELMPLIYGCPFQLIKGYKILEYRPIYCGRYDTLSMHFSSLDELPDKNAANACAKMLIYLIENEIIKNEK